MAASTIWLPQLPAAGSSCSAAKKASSIGQARSGSCSQCSWASGRSIFLTGFSRERLTLDCLPMRTKKGVPHSGKCRALGVPDALNLISTGASVLAPLGGFEGETLLRGAAVTAVSSWYLTAKPGAVQGLLDIVWAPASETLFTSFDPTAVRVGKQLGEGSFGVVYKGWIKDRAVGGGGPGVPVVLKKVKSRVSGAEEMRTSELYFNQRLERTAKGSCAEFLGTIAVDRSDHKGKLSSKLSEGLWLVWRYQGPSSLEWFLRRRDALALLAGAILGEESVLVRATKEDTLQRDCAVVQVVTRQLLESLQTIHATGVVHRDVKPLNMVLDEETRAFKLIDLGACVDLRSGYNYVPDETIMDPVYCAPEQYILPISMPDAPPGPLMSLLAPLLFLAHAPDKFDLYSAGLVLMQLAVPSLRSDRTLAQFNNQLAASGYDLDKWRSSKLTFSEAELEILDANDGAAWDLARTLLRPRNGLVCARPTAAAALGHRFLTRPLTWQTEETRAGSGKSRSKSAQKKAGSAKGSTKEKQHAPAPAFSFALPFGSSSKVETPEPEKRGRYRLPFFGRGQEESEVKVGSGASFDRRVKLKARVVASGTQSAVAWSAFLPLGRPRSTRAQSEEAAPSTDRLLGLKRLVGLDAPVVVPTENEEFPHVAALAALLGQRQEAPEGSNQEAEESGNGRTGELMEMGRASASGIARNAVPLALAGAVLGGSAWLGVLFVETSAETGFQLGQNFADIVAALGLLAIVYRYVLKPGLTASPMPLPLPVVAPPVENANRAAKSVPLYARMKRKAGSILERAGLNRAGGMTLGYTKWIVKQSKRASGKKTAEPAAVESKGLLRSLQEMEQQLASLEEAARGGAEFNQKQKQLLNRVEALLRESNLQAAQGDP